MAVFGAHRRPTLHELADVLGAGAGLDLGHLVHVDELDAEEGPTLARPVLDVFDLDDAPHLADTDLDAT